MKEYKVFNPGSSLLSDDTYETILAASPAKAAELYAKKHNIAGKPTRHLSRYGGGLLVIGRNGSYLYDFV